VLVWTVIRTAGAEASPPVKWRPRFVSALLVGALVMNSASPYLGLKTQASFSMYSNLRTEGTEWNHAIMPSFMRIMSLQDTLVTVLEVGRTDATLTPLAETGNRVVPFEARRAIRIACRDASGPLPLRLSVGDEVVVFSDACAEPPLGGPNPWVLEKLFWFRSLPVVNRCYH
jgi:hypothetical protein